jgi:hypothetical protein
MALYSDARIALISIRFAPSQRRLCSQRAISRQMAIQRRATSECSSYRNDVNARGSQWSVHPIDAIQRLLLGLGHSAAQLGRASTMQAASQLTPTLGGRWPLKCAKLISSLMAVWFGR